MTEPTVQDLEGFQGTEHAITLYRSYFVADKHNLRFLRLMQELETTIPEPDTEYAGQRVITDEGRTVSFLAAITEHPGTIDTLLEMHRFREDDILTRVRLHPNTMLAALPHYRDLPDRTIAEVLSQRIALIDPNGETRIAVYRIKGGHSISADQVRTRLIATAETHLGAVSVYNDGDTWYEPAVFPHTELRPQ